MRARLASVLADLSEPEAKVLWEALGQYVDNVKDAISTDDGMGEAQQDREINLFVAESILEKMDAAIAALAE